MEDDQIRIIKKERIDYCDNCWALNCDTYCSHCLIKQEASGGRQEFKQ